MTTTVTARQHGLSWRQVGGDIIILDEQTMTYLQCAGSGAFLWPLIVEGSTTTELANKLVTRYGIDLDRANQDVSTFVAELARRQLVVGATA